MYSDDADINSVFDNIALSEQRISKASYDKGFREGASESSLEGYKFGYVRGVEIGLEIGNFYGIVAAYSLIAKSDRIKRALAQFKTDLDSFPKSNYTETDIVGGIQNLRTNFKQIKAMLRIPADGSSEKQIKDLSF